MQNELDIVRDVSARLEQGGLAYMLTGSMAMNYYAQPRMTRDIDLVIALELPDTDLIVRLFTPGYYVSREAVSSSIAHAGHGRSSCLVQRDDAGAAKPQVVLKTEARAGKLAQLSRSAQLVRQFVALRQTGGAQRVPL